MNNRAFHQYLYDGEQLYRSPEEEQSNAISGFVVLVDDKEKLRSEDSELMDKILGAIGKNTSTSMILSANIKTSDLQNATVLAFLEKSTAEGLGLTSYFQLSSMGTSRILLSHPLSELRESKDMKLSLWAELKKLQ